ncbi:MAG TPA: NAD(P)-dependent alcohol dehydrogenase [Archangium sp.]|nr:NAD(P)-dependent alcohol dehydrogenase [Archangium sp.]
MKAITYSEFGGIDVLKLSEVEAPRPHKGEVLVRVHAASINPLDAKIRRGDLKLMSGTRLPKLIGNDFAGVVVALGEGVEGLAVGEEVYGGVRSAKDGCLAEYVTTPAQNVARQPASLSFIEAATVPVVAVAALQGLRKVGEVKKGMSMLVNGCTGGVGLYALQLARHLGARVTGVCGTEGVALAREFGAEQVIDYRQQRLSEHGQRYDVLFELSGRLPFSQAHELMNEHGVYIDINPSPAGLVGNTLANPFRAQKHRFLLTQINTRDLEELTRLFEARVLRPRVDKVFPLPDFAAAFTYAERGGVQGKVAIQLVA